MKTKEKTRGQEFEEFLRFIVTRNVNEKKKKKVVSLHRSKEQIY